MLAMTHSQWGFLMADIDVRKGMPSVQLDKAGIQEAFPGEVLRSGIRAGSSAELDKIADVAWKAYDDYHKSPRTRKAGEGFADPDLRSVGRMAGGARRYRRRPSAGRKTRNHRRASCWSTARRAASTPAPAKCRRPIGWSMIAKETIEQSRRLRSRTARPVAAGLANTAASSIRARPASRPRSRSATGRASCYPNHALGQAGDWMDEIYPKWVAAHGVMIVTPGQLVPGALVAQADDRPAGLRRRRQSRPDLDPRQGPGESQRDRAARAGPIRATSPAAFSRSSCTATPPAPRTCAAS